MAKNKCVELTNLVSNNVNEATAAYRRNVEGLVNDLFGYDSYIIPKLSGEYKLEKKALAAWKKMKSNLVNQLMENGAPNYNIYQPDYYLDSIKDYIQKQAKIYGSPETLWKEVSPRRILAISKLVNKLINLQRTRWGKKLPWLERAFLPATMFAMRIDPLGYIHNFAMEAVNLLENSRQSSAKWRSEYKEINSDFIQIVRNIAESTRNEKGYIPIEYFINGKEDVPDKDGKRWVYYGAKQNAEGDTVHIVSEDHDEPQQELPGNQFDPHVVTEALINKYVFELTNDMMSGQARYVNWLDDPDEIDNQWIKDNVIDKIAVKTSEDKRSGIKETHQTTFNGVEYTYVLVPREGEEQWNGYILRHKTEDGRVIDYWGQKNIDNPNKHKMEQLSKGPFRQGFFKSDDHKTYGKFYDIRTKRVDKTDREKGWNFNNLGQRWLKNQPSNDIIFARTKSKDPRMQSRMLFKVLSDLSAMYKDISQEAVLMGMREEEDLNEWLATGKDDESRISRALKKYLPAVDANNLMEQLDEVFAINKNFWVDAQGAIHTPNTIFNPMLYSYAPVIYDNEAHDEMLQEAIEDLEERIGIGQYAEGETEELLKQRLREFQLTQTRKYPRGQEDLIADLENKLNTSSSIRNARSTIIASRNVHLKHRAQYTDLTRRRRDPGVHGAYLTRMYYGLYKNRLMLTMLETMENLATKAPSADVFKENMQWVINRARIAFHDPASYGGIGKWNYSYDKIAELMNSIPLSHGKWDAESTMKFMTWTKGMMSGALLGASGAMINRTQTMNTFIGVGLKYTSRAWRILRNQDPSFPLAKAEAIIDNAGTDEVTNMFMDMMAHGTPISLKDAGLIEIPGIPVQVPTPTWVTFLKLIRANRQTFIDKGIPEIDKGLIRIELERINKIKSELEQQRQKIALMEKKHPSAKVRSTLKALKKEEGRLIEESQKRDVSYVRKTFVDLLMTPKKDNNYKALKAKLLHILGDVTENRLRRMIAWKLSWWPEGFAPELFTFTEGERFMRKHSAIAALLMAQELGQLGAKKELITKETIDEKTGMKQMIEVEDIFLTPTAARIARNAVANEMFGMSIPHLGEAFNGFGAQLGLYKAYPLNQMIHDWKVFETFMAGNVHWTEAFGRLTTASAHMVKKAWDSFQTGREFRYNPKDPTLDHEAIQVLRLMGSRVAASAAAVVMEGTRLFRFVLRSPFVRQFNSMIRGAENPALAITFRVMINAMIMASLDDDELLTGEWTEISWDLMRLFLPVFITLPASLIQDYIE